MVTNMSDYNSEKKTKRVSFESFHKWFGNEPFQICHCRVVFIAVTICRCCFEIFKINNMDILMLIISYSIVAPLIHWIICTYRWYYILKQINRDGIVNIVGLFRFRIVFHKCSHAHYYQTFNNNKNKTNNNTKQEPHQCMTFSLWLLFRLEWNNFFFW